MLRMRVTLLVFRHDVWCEKTRIKLEYELGEKVR